MTMPDLNIVLQFAFATLLPVVASVIIAYLEEHSLWRGANYWAKQTVYGLVFGAIAVFGTEAGIVTHDATMNVRDAAPLVAGLYFGGPAGIIAGLIGGVERWLAALWGRGMFTRVACSVATICAGFYAAIMRRYLFENKKPGWLLALSIGIVVEVLHLLLVFVTNLDDSVHAFLVVRACSAPMITCNAISVALAGAVLTLMGGNKLVRDSETPEISQRVRTGMLAVVVGGFAATLAIVYGLQSSMIRATTMDTLTLELQDTENDIQDASDAHLLELARRAARTIPSVDSAQQEVVDSLIESLDVAELHVVDETGVIVMSSSEEYVGFDMSSGKQAAEFLPLLPGGSASEVVQNYQPITMDAGIWRKYAGVSIEGGFLQVAYDAEHFTSNIVSEVRFAVANRHVGKEGLFVVIGERDALVGRRQGVSVDYWDVQRLSGSMAKAKEGDVFETIFHNETYYAMYSMVEGMRVLALLPASEAEMERDLSVFVIAFMEVVVFAALFVAIFILIQRVVVSSIWQVNGRLGEITRGDLNVKVDVRDSLEFASLSDDINRTVSALRDAIAAESARIERDLSTAKAIQESALPSSFPPFPDIDAFDIFALMDPAKEVGGDFYDFFLVDDHTLGFLIADVSGKGIPGALFMMASKTELSNYIKSGMELAEAVHSANWDLCQQNDAGMFVTVWAATLDYNTGDLTYVNAGHNPPLLRHNGTWHWLREKGGLFLGTFETAKYRSTTIRLSPGDELLLYTDGVNEAFSIDDEEYGNDRLEALLSAHTNLHARSIVDALKADVNSWTEGAEQSDDITILALEYGTAPEVMGNFIVPATPEGLAELMRKVHFEFSQIQCPETVQTQFDRTIEHFFTVMMRHGTAATAKQELIEAAYRYVGGQNALIVTLTDWKDPFDPILEEVPGEGTDDMRAYVSTTGMDDIAYVRDDECNVVAFRKAW